MTQWSGKDIFIGSKESQLSLFTGVGLQASTNWITLKTALTNTLCSRTGNLLMGETGFGWLEDIGGGVGGTGLGLRPFGSMSPFGSESGEFFSEILFITTLDYTGAIHILVTTTYKLGRWRNLMFMTALLQILPINKQEEGQSFI